MNKIENIGDGSKSERSVDSDDMGKSNISNLIATSDDLSTSSVVDTASKGIPRVLDKNLQESVSHGQTSDLFIKFFKKLVRAASDVNGIPYSVMFNYWKIRISTTMQKYNAKIIHMSQNKIARVTRMLRNGDADLNDIITDQRHVHNFM